MPHAQSSPAMADCIVDCRECATTCLETARHCLEMGGEHAAAEPITALLDCAALCTTAADAMSRGSSLHGRVCDVCAEACERCAVECERFPDDETMRRCAEICRRTAESCRAMAAAAA